MAFKFKCPECGTSMIGLEGSIGQHTQCASCQATFPVPEPPLFGEGEPNPDKKRRDGRPPSRDRGEPRPRRRLTRRPPPLPLGRGPLIWVALILGGMVLGTLTCCGGGYALLPGEKWHRHRSLEGGFAVDLLAPAQNGATGTAIKADPLVKGLEGEEANLWKRGEVFIIAWIPVLPGRQRALGDNAVFDMLLRELKLEPETAQIVRTDRITVSGFLAREIECVYPDGGTRIVRLIIANRRMYVIVAGGRFVRPGNANVRRFIDSFEITAPEDPPPKTPDRLK